MKDNARLPVVLTIAGSDSGGGAGIQADLKTFFALRCHGTSAITCLTAQNTTAVDAIHAAPPSFVAQQIKTITADFSLSAIKTGMLYSKAIIESVVDTLKCVLLQEGAADLAIVVDPVMVAASGARLVEANAIEAMKEQLLPLATIVTPNVPEAEAMLHDYKDSSGSRPFREISSIEAMKGAAQAVCDLYNVRSCLIKGGHLTAAADPSEAADVLFVRETGRHHVFAGKRLPLVNVHGTGCTLASAIAAFLARGKSVDDACRLGKAYVKHAIEAAYPLGSRSRGLEHRWSDDDVL
ncbi:unnamed protein product [Vitrella brassicaformis CCMP3155]|uniref:Pyridoxamine kinase/Phosphomethylpyrimidine kinase domain-containing protein n=2 Tax=Vitrella brassicaformis TaxID=1169539 RepID=A0A0G4FP48_VITBC|nr:unnamed protein product [Vitrella brassicaformis CCMP3155]|eukprot:CEM15597.1 unnamed protein product [Vitrella brassicaformis CCMP3155]